MPDHRSAVIKGRTVRLFAAAFIANRGKCLSDHLGHFSTASAASCNSPSIKSAGSSVLPAMFRELNSTAHVSPSLRRPRERAVLPGSTRRTAPAPICRCQARGSPWPCPFRVCVIHDLALGPLFRKAVTEAHGREAQRVQDVFLHILLIRLAADLFRPAMP